jgi:four helix bundle protein
MANIESFEDLKIWQDARSLVPLTYNLMQTNKDYGFKDQIQRASVSIMNNPVKYFLQ